MKNLTNICVVLLICSSLFGQRFACDGQLFVATHNGITTSISRPIYILFIPPLLSPFVNYHGSFFDALGFNSKDFYIYAVQEETNAIIRLKSDNTYDTIGLVSLVDTLKVRAGDCTVDGLYMCYEETLDQLLVFDVVEDFNLRRRIDLYWDPASPNIGAFNTKIFDFAIDPNDPSTAYAYQGIYNPNNLQPEATNGYLLKININFDSPDLGKVTPLYPLNPDYVSHIGGFLFGPAGGLFGFGTSEVGSNPWQTNLFSINVQSGQVEHMSKNPVAFASDGCSCPFSFNFYNKVPTEGMLCNGDVKTFLLTIENNSFNAIEEVIVRDTIPDGMIIREVRGVLMDNVESISGVDSGILEIIGLDLPPKSVTEIEVIVESIDAPLGFTYNQAYLHNLPERFEGVLQSDDIETNLEEDASLFTVIPLTLDEVTYEVTKPTNCLNANDGQIRLFSPQFASDQEYEVKIRNRVGWDEKTYRVFADAENSFLIDSLIPGDYQFFEIKAINDNCALALRNFSIEVEPPHNDLDLTISGDSPLCEGQDLVLNSTSQNANYIRWTGPSSFGSEEADPIIENAVADNSGMYYITAEYGKCSRFDTLEVIVKPLTNTIITGDSLYCERDVLRLNAEGVGEDLVHTWSGPSLSSSSSNTLTISSITNDQEGAYQVITSNGACIDTVTKNIIVQPTPTIELPAELLTDFCDPTFLSPTITGDNNVSYRWFPGEGLSCVDCPAPQIEPIIEPQYNLVVENEYFCKDSAEIAINLDKDKLAYMPNIFHPLGGGTNSQFGVFPGCISLSVSDFQIYDRWGNVVFYSEFFSVDEEIESWSGFIEGQVGNSGIYLWTARVQLVDGSYENLKGGVTLLGGN